MGGDPQGRTATLTGSPTLRERLRRTGSGVRNRDGNRQDCDPLTAFGVYD
ncbi:hypothetical protein QUB80_02185 [Chlorogloeopsis sp. ULAP01]|nr:hypothetical protein [Chlorogloeopsis sp. ULAP01]MDM9379510.1 hypothetical protein [Chlorogloeopsis sp. ULAP01]